MNRTEKANETFNSLTALSNAKYKKDDYLPEMLKLQQQMAAAAFNNPNSEAKIWDIYNHLDYMNFERKSKADIELAKFKEDCAILSYRIKAEISGKKGESYTNQALERLKNQNIVLRNIELEADGKRTEIDFLVFTSKAIFILEVKNTARNIYIDADGDYYRRGRSMYLDCNIKEKMNLREEILTKILNNAGFHRTNIVKMLVFTDNRIRIENKCKDVLVTFPNQLPYRIPQYNGWHMFTEDCMNMMSDAVNESRLVGEYKFDIDVNIMKRDFAELMAALEPEENRFFSLIRSIKDIFSLSKTA